MERDTLPPCLCTEEATPPSEALLELSPNHWLLLLTICMSVAVLPGNLLTIFAFIKDQQVRVPANYLICNQSFIDVLNAIFFVVFAFFNYETSGVKILGQNEYICLLILCPLGYTSASSAVNILTISVQRLIFVIYPMTPRSDHSASATMAVILLSQAILVIIFSLPFLLVRLNSMQLGETVSICSFSSVVSPSFSSFVSLMICACLSGIIVVNIFIYYRYRRQMKLVEPSPSTLQNPVGIKKEWSITMMLFIVAVTYLVTWAPVLVTIVVYRLIPGIRTNGWFLLFAEGSRLCCMASGIANPFIYVKKNLKFKNAFKKVFRMPIAVTNTSQ